MQPTLTVLAQVGILVFIVAGMAAMGLDLTVRRIAAPLRSTRLVVGVLVANFVVVPIFAIVLARLVIPESESATAIILFGCCAGAPFLPTLARLAKADAAKAVGVMVLLMLLSVAFAPLVIPMALADVSVNPTDIAGSLVLYMLAPLSAGLLVRGRYPELAAVLVDRVRSASTAGLALGTIAGLAMTWRQAVNAVGSWIFVGTGAVLLVGYGAGRAAAAVAQLDAAGGRLIGLATAQRNVSAALVVAETVGGEVMVRTLVAALLTPLVLMIVASELGKRRSGTSTQSQLADGIPT